MNLIFASQSVLSCGSTVVPTAYCCTLHIVPQIWENYHDRPNWRVVTKTDSYSRDYSSSTFCLAAPGGGWGKRGIVAAM